MYNVREMSKEDIPFAGSLADTMRWNLGAGDFEFMMELEPKGCFTLLCDSERVGIVTTVAFDNLGWFSNLIVCEDHRGKGAGALLATHAIRYLKDKGVSTIGLYAYTERISFYRKLGFQYDSDFIVLKGTSSVATSAKHVRQAKKADIEKILGFDYSCLGVDRKRMLEPILLDEDNLCYVSAEDRKLNGYIIAKVFNGMAEMGPLVCESGYGNIAVDLINTVLSRLENFEVSMCVSNKQTAILRLLQTRSLEESFRVARMFHGPTFNRGCIFMAESLERG